RRRQAARELRQLRVRDRQPHRARDGPPVREEPDPDAAALRARGPRRAARLRREGRGRVHRAHRAARRAGRGPLPAVGARRRPQPGADVLPAPAGLSARAMRRRWLLPATLLGATLLAAWWLLRPSSPGDGFASGNGRIEATEIDVATKIPG